MSAWTFLVANDRTVLALALAQKETALALVPEESLRGERASGWSFR